jgi:hypothetical protein
MLPLRNFYALAKLRFPSPVAEIAALLSQTPYDILELIAQGIST